MNRYDLEKPDWWPENPYPKDVYALWWAWNVASADILREYRCMMDEVRIDKSNGKR